MAKILLVEDDIQVAKAIIRSALALVCLFLPLLAGCTRAADEKPAADAESKPARHEDALDRYSTSPERISRQQAFVRYMTKDHRNFSPDDYVNAADRACESLDYDSAIFFCSEALKQMPSYSRAYAVRGRARMYSSMDELAVRDLEKAVSMHYPGPEAYEFLASIYDSRHETEKALAAINSAIKLGPNERRLYQNRAALHVAAGEKEKAKEDYAKWMSLGPDDVTPYVLRGQLLESMKDYEGALKDYAIAAAKKETRGTMSKRTLAMRLQAALLSKLDRHSEALAVLSKAVSIDQGDDELLRLRGQEYAALKKYDQAIHDYNESIEMAPSFSRATLEARSKAYDAIGKKDLAEKDRLEAMKIQQAPAEKQLVDPAGGY